MSQGVWMNSSVYCFGRFRLDVETRQLADDSSVRTLPENIFRVLLLLLQADGGVVTRDEFFDAIWPSDSVCDANLTQHIFLLRNMLGRVGDEYPYVVTVARRGYRLGVRARLLEARMQEPAGALADLPDLEPYWAAHHQLERLTYADLMQAAGSFERMQAKHSLSTRAHIGLASAYMLLGRQMLVHPAHAFYVAKQAVHRALAIDACPAAYALLAQISLFGDWDWERSWEALQTAHRFGDQPSPMRIGTADVLLANGDAELALFELAQALEHQPASHRLLTACARIYLHRKEYIRAIDILAAVLEREPAFATARYYCALAYACMGEWHTAGQVLEASPDAADTPFLTALSTYVLAADGKRDRALAAYDALLGASRERYVASWHLALAATGVGHAAAALAHLEDAYAAREPALLFLPRMPLFSPIAAHDGFIYIASAVAPAPRRKPGQNASSVSGNLAS